MRALVLAALIGAVAAPVAAQQAPQQRQIKLDVSPAGQAVMKKYLGSPDPQAQALVKQMQGVVGQLRALPKAPKLDLARMQALMRQQETLESQLRRRSNDRTLAMLREMSEADRLKFLRGLEAAGQQRAAAAAAQRKK